MKMQQIVRLAIADKTTEEIASIMGLSTDSINELMTHPSFAVIEEKAVGLAYSLGDEMLARRKANVILEECAPDAAEALVALLRSDDDVTKRQAATNILDRAGFGPIQRKAIRAKLELDPVAARLLKDAFEESRITNATIVDVEPTPHER